MGNGGLVMRGVGVDALNPAGRPLVGKLGRLDSVRVEMRDDPLFYQYVGGLALDGIQLAYLYGPSTTNFQKILQDSPRPGMIILGNEPDGSGDSSWKMSFGRYKSFWRQNAKIAAKYATGVPICAAGLINDPSYLETIWDQLNPQPNMVNKHYPGSSSEIVAMRLFGVPVVIGEHCSDGATQDEMNAWRKDLDRFADHDFWFCWSDGMVNNQGLVGKTGYQKNNYKRWQAAA